MKALLAVCLLVACSAPLTSSAQFLTRHRPGPVTIRGVSANVGSHGFTLRTTSHGSYSVVVTRDTAVTVKGRPTSLHGGDHVGVRGYVSGRRIMAITVHVYPTKPKIKTFSVNGTVTGLAAATITVRSGGRAVQARLTAQTIVRLGRNAGSIRQIRIGDHVLLRVQKAGNHLVALHIHVYARKTQGKSVDVQGMIASIRSGSLSVRSGRTVITVRLTSKTLVYLGASRVSLASLRLGETVRVFACCAGQGLIAHSVHIKRSVSRRSTQLLYGRIMAVGPDRLVLHVGATTVSVRLNRATVYEAGAARTHRDPVRVGDQVSIRAYRSGTTLVAVRVHVFTAYRRAHTVVGVVVAFTRNGLLVAARGKRYTVVTTARTSVVLNGRASRVAMIRAGDHIRATGMLVGTVVTATHILARRVPPKTRTIRGTVRSINGSQLVIVDSNGAAHPVHLGAGARVTIHGKIAPRAALFLGVHATARGTVSRGVLIASTVALTVTTRSVKGRIHAANPSVIVVSLSTTHRISVDLPRGVPISDGPHHLGAGALRIGAFVSVTGYTETSSRIRATTVRVQHPSLDLAAVVLTAGSAFTVRTTSGDSYRLAISTDTAVSAGRENVAPTVEDIPVGAHVHVKGSIRSDGVMTAQRITVRLTSFTGRGKLTLVGGSDLTYATSSGSVHIRVGDSTTFYQGSRAISESDLVVGDDVTVYGYVGANRVLARKLAVHRPLVGLDGTIQSVGADGFTMRTAAGTIHVITGASTQISTSIAVEASVHVTGYRRGDGTILATRVRAGKKHAVSIPVSEIR